MSDVNIDERGPVAVAGLPDDVRAVAKSAQKDRRGNTKTKHVIVTAATRTVPVRAPVQPSEATFVLGGSRRAWQSIVDRYGRDAWRVALDYVAAGLVDVEVTTRLDTRGGDGAPFVVDEPVCWRRTPAATRLHEQRTAETRDRSDRIRAAAADAADRIVDIDPGLAATLADPGLRGDAVVKALTFAAGDLAAGRRYDGPRAWSQTHYPTVAGDPSKHRDDIADLLAAADADAYTIAALGIGRPADFGIGNLAAVQPDGGVLLISWEVTGVVRFDPDQPLKLLAPSGTTTLAVVENLQAAQAVAAAREAAVAYTAGVPSAAACRLIGEAADRFARVLVVPDADLGGVRIAERVVAALRDRQRVTVVDVGAASHSPGVPFTDEYRRLLERRVDGLAGALASAVLQRGYRVEQEATIRAALTAAIGR